MKLTAKNYYSKEANLEYMSVSLFKDFAGTYGRIGCEHHAYEKLMGRWHDKPNDAMLIGSYVDAFVEGADSYLDFQKSHPEMFRNDGTLYKKYAIAETVIQRIVRDEYFMAALSGDKQVIMTGEKFGTKWKCKIDSYIPHQAIVDLKVIKDIYELKWVKDVGYMDFIRYWGYDVQGAMYQELVFQNTGEKLPFYIAAVTKDECPDMEVIKIPQYVLDEAIDKVWFHMPGILSVLHGEREPDRCEQCACCRETKKLSGYINLDELVGIGGV